MLLITLQVLFSFLCISSILLRTKGYFISSIFTIVFYLLANISFILRFFKDEKIEINKALIQLALLRFISTLSIQLDYLTITPNNFDILLQKPVIFLLLENRRISYIPSDYSFTNCIQYANYPITEILIGIINNFTNIPIPLIQKYFAVFLSPLVVYPVYKIGKTIFNNPELALLSTFTFLLTPWLIFFHSHSVHESLGFLIVAFILSELLTLKELNKKNIIKISLFLLLLTFTHHFSSLLLIFSLFMIIIVFLLNYIFNHKKNQTNNKVVLFYLIYSFSFLTSSTFIWGLRKKNLMFRLIMDMLFNILREIHWFFYPIIFSIILLMLFLVFLIYKYYQKSKIESILNYCEIKLLEHNNFVIISILFISLIISILFLKFNFVYTTTLLPNSHYLIISLGLISQYMLYALGILFFLKSKLKTIQQPFLFSFSVISILFMIVMILFYIGVNWSSSSLTNFFIRERIQVMTSLFVSLFVGLASYKLFKVGLLYKRFKVTSFLFILYISLFILSSMFYSFQTRSITDNLIFKNADDKRLYSNEWENVGLYFRENRDYFKNLDIVSSYRGKIFIEGYAVLPVYDLVLPIYVKLYNQSESFYIKSGTVFVFHSSMLKLPFSGSPIPLQYELFNKIKENSVVLYSSENILVLQSFGVYVNWEQSSSIGSFYEINLFASIQGESK